MIMQMEKYKVQDKTSQLYGGFEDSAAQQADSFDNLMALRAYTHQSQVFTDVKAGAINWQRLLG